MATAITWSGVTFTGTPNADDILAAQVEVAKENAYQIALNPAFTPLAITPAATLKASYITTILNRITRTHNDAITNAKNRGTMDSYFSAADIATITANLVSRAAGGEATSSIVTDTAS